MESVINQILSQVYKVTFNLLRHKTINSIQEGDVSLEIVRDQLMTHIEKLQQGIDAIRMKELHASVIKQQTALTHVRYGNYVEAAHHFRSALNDAVMAFGVVQNFHDKVLSTRIQILCQMHLSFYFYDGPNNEKCNLELLKELCHDAFKRLYLLPHVSSALGDEFEGRNIFRVLASTATRRNPHIYRHHILYEISALNTFFLCNLQSRFPVMSNQTAVILANTKPIVFKPPSSTMKPWQFIVYHDKLYVSFHESGKGDCSDSHIVPSGIYCYDLSTFALCCRYVGSKSWLKDIVIDGYYVFAANHQCLIFVWNFATCALLHTFIPCIELPFLYHHRDDSLIVSNDKLYYTYIMDTKIIVVWWNIANNFSSDSCQINSVTNNIAFRAIYCPNLCVHNHKLYFGQVTGDIVIYDLSSAGLKQAELSADLTECRSGEFKKQFIHNNFIVFVAAHVIMVWDIENNVLIDKISLPFGGSIRVRQHLNSLYLWAITHKLYEFNMTTLTLRLESLGTRKVGSAPIIHNDKLICYHFEESVAKMELL